MLPKAHQKKNEMLPKKSGKEYGSWIVFSILGFDIMSQSK
jgi:hypothetical protein